MKKNSLIVKNCIFEHRVSRGWSRSDLAYLAGTSEKTIEAIENNLFCPSVYLALCLAFVFDCQVNDLFTLVKNGDVYL